MNRYIEPNLLTRFDVFPKIFAAGKEAEVNIRNLGAKPMFQSGQQYKVAVYGLSGGSYKHFPEACSYVEYVLTCNEEGGFTFKHTFPSEQQYYLRIISMEGENLYQVPVYCVEGDLIGRYPFQGDTHLHTTFSDGQQIPEVVCAEYRRYGYDFLAITDHRKYYPSLIAMDFCNSIPTELCVCPGEEVHMIDTDGKHNDVHIINFGGEYSVNALADGAARDQWGTDPKYRSLKGECPPTMTHEEYEAFIRERCAEMDLPEGIDVYPAAVCKWIFSEIRKANGLAIFPHPNWVADAFNVPDKFTDFLFEQDWFDAYEVLGGARYYEQNGFQTQRYYDLRAQGKRVPIVGATDSHSCEKQNPGGFICSTIIFSPENECKALIQSVKDCYSVAVDTISAEYRLVGETRLVRYASFLLQYFFPLHNELCWEEGRLMRQCATGTAEEKAEAKALLAAIHGRMERQRKKYFAF